MSLRMGLRPLAVCSALFVFSQIAPAQNKVAVVDLRRAVFECAEIKKADAEMPVKFKTRQDTIDKLQKEIAAISQQLQSSNGKLSPAGRKRSESAGAEEAARSAAADATTCRRMRRLIATTFSRRAPRRWPTS